MYSDILFTHQINNRIFSLNPMDLEDESGLKDIDVSEPSSPVSIVDDDDSCDDGPNASAPRNLRGKGVIWPLISSASYQCFETISAVKQDAKHSNLSKLGASTYNFRKYACKVKGCSYFRKYQQDTFVQIYKIYFSGIYAHQRDETDGDERGLS